MGKRELVALLRLYFWCLVIVVWLFLPVPWVCLHFVLMVFPDDTHYFVQISRVTPVLIHFSILTILEMTYNLEIMS